MTDVLDAKPKRRLKLDLHGAFIPNADFANTDLVEANFSGANCSNGDFSGADLRSAKFVDADISSALFDDANVSGAKFNGAKISIQNLAKARNITFSQIRSARPVGLVGQLYSTVPAKVLEDFPHIINDES